MGGPPPRRSAVEVLEVLATAETLAAAARSLGCAAGSLRDRGRANPEIAEALREVVERGRERYREAVAVSVEVLKETGGNLRKAARSLGISHPAMRARVKQNPELARRLKREQREARAAEIVEALRGRTVRAAAKALGCAPAAVRYWGKRSAAVAEALAEVTARGPVEDPEAKARRVAERGARMVAAIRKHRKAGAAAKALGISPANMTYWAKRIPAVREALDAQPNRRATAERKERNAARERKAAERNAARERKAAERGAARDRKAAERERKAAERRAALELAMERKAADRAERQERRAALELEIERERLIEAQKGAEAREAKRQRRAVEDAARQAVEDAERERRAVEDAEWQAKMVQRARAQEVRRALLAKEMAEAAARWEAQRRAVAERQAAEVAALEARKAAGRRLAGA